MGGFYPLCCGVSLFAYASFCASAETIARHNGGVFIYAYLDVWAIDQDKGGDRGQAGPKAEIVAKQARQFPQPGSHYCRLAYVTTSRPRLYLQKSLWTFKTPAYRNLVLSNRG